MGLSRLFIIAVLGSAACLTSIANASVAPRTAAVSATPKAVSTPATVTAATPQFSCPNCGKTATSNGSSSLVDLKTSIGMFSQVTAATLDLGGGVFHPSHLVTATPAATVPSATPVQDDKEAQAKQQAVAMDNATFSSSFYTDGEVDKEKLGDYFYANVAGMTEDFRDHFFGSDSSGAQVLKSEDYNSPFKAGSANNDGNPS